MVKFPEENSVGVVRSSWLKDNLCLWPTKYLKKYLKSDGVPEEKHCVLCPFELLKFFGKHTYQVRYKDSNYICLCINLNSQQL